jgi:hypothetical protein
MSVQGTFVKNRLHSPDFRRGTLVVGAYLVALCWAGFLYLLVVTSGSAASLVHPMLLGTLGLWALWNRGTKAGKAPEGLRATLAVSVHAKSYVFLPPEAVPERSSRPALWHASWALGHVVLTVVKAVGKTSAGGRNS